MTDFDRYTQLAGATAVYPDRGNNLLYTVLGLVGESGEIAEKLKKAIRDSNMVLSEQTKLLMIYELGDVLWYISQSAYELGVPLSKIVELNLLKLRLRKLRGKLHGSGDIR